AEDVHVPVRHRVGSEYVVVRDDDDFFPIPYFGVFAEFLLEHADGAGTADVMRHENICVDPNIVTGLGEIPARVPSQDLFGHRHASHEHHSEYLKTASR